MKLGWIRVHWFGSAAVILHSRDYKNTSVSWVCGAYGISVGELVGVRACGDMLCVPNIFFGALSKALKLVFKFDS